MAAIADIHRAIAAIADIHRTMFRFMGILTACSETKATCADL